MFSQPPGLFDELNPEKEVIKTPAVSALPCRIDTQNCKTLKPFSSVTTWYLEANTEKRIKQERNLALSSLDGGAETSLSLCI